MDLIIPLLTEDDEEMVIFDMILNDKDRNYHNLKKREGVFRLDELDDNFCFTHFRFSKVDIRRLRVLFEIPEEIILENRIKVSGEEALCILLRRLSYPNRSVKYFYLMLVFYIHFHVNRYCDLMQFFPRGLSALGLIFNAMVEHILQTKGQVLRNVNAMWLSKYHIREFCQSLTRKGSPYPRCFGFLDGTIRPNCGTKYNQRQVFDATNQNHLNQ